MESELLKQSERKSLVLAQKELEMCLKAHLDVLGSRLHWHTEERQAKEGESSLHGSLERDTEYWERREDAEGRHFEVGGELVGL